MSATFETDQKNLETDQKNLRFYAKMFREHQWQTDVIHTEVFAHTLEEIAERIAALLKYDADLRDYIARQTLPLSNKHIHECGTCGQLRECYHHQCLYNVLADCDPETGCKTHRIKELEGR